MRSASLEPICSDLTSEIECSKSSRALQALSLRLRQLHHQLPRVKKLPKVKESKEKHHLLHLSQVQPIDGAYGRMVGVTSFISTAPALHRVTISPPEVCPRELTISSPTISRLAYSADIPTLGSILTHPEAPTLTPGGVVSTRPTSNKVGG